MRTLTCARVSSHVPQRAQRSEHRVPVTEVIEAELDPRLVAVMDHGQLRSGEEGVAQSVHEWLHTATAAGALS